MEIERKFLVKKIPENLEMADCLEMTQAYLCIDPVVRIRKSNQDYYLTYKGRGTLVREEYNLPLNEEAFGHLLAKADGTVIRKKRYQIPIEGGYTAELDIFSGEWEGLLLVEVEFESVEQAQAFCPPEWFGEDVTDSPRYHNSVLSTSTREEIFHE